MRRRVPRTGEDWLVGANGLDDVCGWSRGIQVLVEPAGLVGLVRHRQVSMLPRCLVDLDVEAVRPEVSYEFLG